MNIEKPNCFIIMPISDQDGYEKGHFSRVYEYLIKPACEKAGFNVIRADDEVKTNYIVIDIIKKILESQIVICDLSGKNPNVLYELGLRQAFNKKSLLIKDIKTSRIFDIQGLRTIEYDESLRIDSVQKNIISISNSLKETYELKEGEINSLIQLLSIKPATLTDSFELSNETSLILKTIKDMSSRIDTLSNNNSLLSRDSGVKSINIDGIDFQIDFELYLEDKHVGTIVDIHPDKVFALDKKNHVLVFTKNNPDFKSLKSYPF